MAKLICVAQLARWVREKVTPWEDFKCAWRKQVKPPENLLYLPIFIFICRCYLTDTCAGDSPNIPVHHAVFAAQPDPGVPVWPHGLNQTVPDPKQRNVQGSLWKNENYWGLVCTCRYLLTNGHDQPPVTEITPKSQSTKVLIPHRLGSSAISRERLCGHWTKWKRPWVVRAGFQQREIEHNFSEVNVKSPR